MMNIAIFRHHGMLGYETYAINASSNRHLDVVMLFAMNIIFAMDE